MPSHPATITEPLSADDTAARLPEAVQFARAFREVFGPETRLIYAKNQAGEVLGSSVFADMKLAVRASGHDRAPQTIE